MLGALNKSKYGNCLNDNTPLLIVSDKTEDSVSEVMNAFDIPEESSNNIYFDTVDESSSEYSDNVNTYIRKAPVHLLYMHFTLVLIVYKKTSPDSGVQRISKEGGGKSQEK